MNIISTSTGNTADPRGEFEINKVDNHTVEAVKSGAGNLDYAKVQVDNVELSKKLEDVGDKAVIDLWSQPSGDNHASEDKITVVGYRGGEAGLLTCTVFDPPKQQGVPVPAGSRDSWSC